MRKVDEISQEEERAKDLWNKFLIIDGSGASAPNRESFEVIRETGLHAVTKIMGDTRGRLIPTLYSLMEWWKRLRSMKDLVILVEKPDDIERARREGKVGAILHTIQSGYIEDDVDFIELFYRGGIRISQITHNPTNQLAYGVDEGARVKAPLKELGIRAVEKMNEVGMLVDLTHLGWEACNTAIEVSKDPPVFSHANSITLCNNSRNIPDELMQACAEKGGVIGVTSYPSFVMRKGQKDCSVEDYLDHIDYDVNLVGINHVGIGFDIQEDLSGTVVSKLFFTQEHQKLLKMFPHIYKPWPGHYCPASVTEYPSVVKGLVVRGYSDQEIEKIVSGNWMRVYRQVWKTCAKPIVD